MSSALCSVAIEIVEPAMNTGSSTANGVTAPVRPTLTSILLQQRRLLFGRKLERDGPPRKLAGGAERPAMLDVVDLDDDAVGVEVERASLVPPLAAERDELVDAAAALPVPLHRQAPAAELLERLGRAIGVPASGRRPT